MADKQASAATTAHTTVSHSHHVVHHQGHHQEPELNPLEAIFVFYLIMFVMMGGQVGLLVWRQRHRRSYELVSLLGLWIIPTIISWTLGAYRFVVIWLLYSAVTAYQISKCVKRPMAPTAPRQVYTWFLASHQVSMSLGVMGYILMLTYFWLEPLYTMLLSPTVAPQLLLYGIYFGVLGRDVAEFTSDFLARRLGTSSNLAARVGTCGLCQGPIAGVQTSAFTTPVDGAAKQLPNEKSYVLTCKHEFHELCLRGWTMVGKKDTCPVCNEKVDLGVLYAQRPWERQYARWNQMLDAFRALVVWVPLLILFLNAVLRLLGIKHHDPPATDVAHHAKIDTDKVDSTAKTFGNQTSTVNTEEAALKVKGGEIQQLDVAAAGKGDALNNKLSQQDIQQAWQGSQQAGITVVDSKVLATQEGQSQSGGGQANAGSVDQGGGDQALSLL